MGDDEVIVVLTGLMLLQQIDCDPNGLTLHYRYRSSYSGSPGNPAVIVHDRDNPTTVGNSKYLNNNQATWLSDTLDITFSPANNKISVIFWAGYVAGQILDIDDVYFASKAKGSSSQLKVLTATYE